LKFCSKACTSYSSISIWHKTFALDGWGQAKYCNLDYFCSLCFYVGVVLNLLDFTSIHAKNVDIGSLPMINWGFRLLPRGDRYSFNNTVCLEKKILFFILITLHDLWGETNIFDLNFFCLSIYSRPKKIR